MKFQVKTKTEQILTILKVLAWIAFFSFIIKAALLVFVYFQNQWNPENILEEPDTYKLRQDNIVLYSVLMGSYFLMYMLKASVWWMVVKLINKIKLANPFTREIAHSLEFISYLLFAVWVLSATAGGFSAWVEKMDGNLKISWNHEQFLFMAGLVFIISQIFKRGVEIQSENDLTV